MRCAWLAAIVVGACLAVPAWAQVVSVDVREDNATLTLQWPQPATVEVVTNNARELAVRFDQPVQYDAFAAALPRLARWVDGAFFGYDSLVLTLAMNVRGSAAVRDGKIDVILGLEARSGEAPSEPPPSTEARKRLRQLKANLLWSKGQAEAALDLLAELVRDYPNDKEFLAARGMVATRLELWRLSSTLVADAQTGKGEQRPRNWPLRGNEHAPKVTATAIADRQGGAGDRLGVRATGHTFVGAGVRLGASYEGATVKAEPGQWLASVGGAGSQRHQGLLHLRYDGLGGNWCAIRGGASGTQPALGAECALWSIVGATALAATWDEPRWDLPVFAGLGTVRTGVHISQAARSFGDLGRALAGELSGRLSAGYEVWKAGASLAGLAAQGQVQYVSWRARPRWTAAWSFQHFTPLGDPPKGALGQVLPRFHIHNLVGGVQWNLWQWLTIDAYAGYGLNLWGPNAVQLGGGLGWAPAAGLQASLRAQQGLVPTAVGSTSTALFASVGHAW